MNLTTLLGVAVALVVAVSMAFQHGGALLQKFRAARAAAKPVDQVAKSLPAVVMPAVPHVAWVKEILDAAGQKADPQFVLDHLRLGSNREAVMVARIKQLEELIGKPAVSAVVPPKPAPAPAPAPASV